MTAFLSLGGASLVIAGQPQGGNDKADNGGGKGHAYGQQEAAPAPAAAAPATAVSSDGGSQGKSKGAGAPGQAKKAPAQSPSAPAQSKKAPAESKSAPAESKSGNSKSKSAPAPSEAPAAAPKHTSSDNGGGSHSTATSGPGSSAQGCDGSHNSNTGHGANHSGPYDNTCDGSPSGNGNGNGKATGKPCAGCVGNADDKNPKGQYPNGSDHNAGYECDRNHGIGRTNPAHTGCKTTEQPPTTGTVTPPAGGENPATDNGHGNPCPDAKLSTSLVKTAALALQVIAVTHPELSQLSEMASAKAAESCGTPASNDNGNENGNGHTPITICHATGSMTNPYVEITIDTNGLNGHASHQDDRDIIPAPAGGCPKGETTPPAGGENGQQDNGGQPNNENGNENGNGHTPITICHATGSMTNPYVEITIDENGLNGHAKHQDDIIPAPAGGCPTGSTTTPPAGGQQPGDKDNTPPAGGEQPNNNGNTPPTEGQTVSPLVPLPQSTPAPGAENAPANGEAPAGQEVLGERVSGKSAPATTPAQQGVLGENASGTTPAPASTPAAPASVQRAVTAGPNNEGGSLPFTGTDAMLVLLIGCLMLLAGFTLQRVARRSS